MNVEVLVPFYDKENLSHIFQVGEIVEFADTRAEDIIARGLGKCVTETEEAEKEVEDTEKVSETTEEAEKEAPAEATDEEPKKRGRKPKVSE